MTRSALLILLAGLITRPALAAAPVPERNRIGVRLVHVLEGPGDSPLQMPTDVAVASNGVVYVADGVNHRLARFGANGEYLGALTALGDVSLENPLAVHIDVQQRLWVADADLHAIILSDLEGAGGEVITLPSVSGHEPSDPTDIAVTADGGRTYVVDNDHDRVLIRDNAGGAFVSLGKTGEGLGEFQWPYMLALDQEGYVYITDVIGARLHRLNRTDDWLPPISRWGIELGRLYRPKGVAIDGERRIHVSDSTLCVVQAFNYRGGVLGVLTDETGTPRRFDHPMGLAFGPHGRLYVVESLGNRVAVLEYEHPVAAPADTRGRRQP